jgi:hypothetical protein
MQEILSIQEKMAPQPEIPLYEELLECLEGEWQALINSQEDAILVLAAQKEHILEKILALTSGRAISNPERQEDYVLSQLKRQAAAAQARNHRLIAAALETIQDFLGYLQSSPPGIYHSAGKVETVPGSPLFHRQA